MKLLNMVKEWRLDESVTLYSFLIFGILLSGKKFLDIIASTDYLTNAIVLHISFFLLLISFFFALNDFFDFELDSLNKNTRNALVKGILSKKSMFALMMVTGLAGIVLTYFINLYVFALVVLTFFSVYLYSGMPFRFKGKPFVDLLTHSLPGYFLVMVGFLTFAAFDFKIIYYSLVGFLFFVVICIAQEMRDYETDKKAGLRTTVITLGLEKSMMLMKALSIAAYVLTAYILITISFKFIPFLCAGLPFLIILLLTKKEDAINFLKKTSVWSQMTSLIIVALALVYALFGLI